MLMKDKPSSSLLKGELVADAIGKAVPEGSPDQGPELERFQGSSGLLILNTWGLTPWLCQRELMGSSSR